MKGCTLIIDRVYKHNNFAFEVHVKGYLLNENIKTKFCYKPQIAKVTIEMEKSNTNFYFKISQI